MTKTKKMSLGLLALFCAVCLGVGLASCGSKDVETNYGYGEEGTYYYDASDGSEYLLTLRNGTAVQSYEGGGSAAEYSYDAEGNLLTFYEEGEETGTGSLSDAGLTVTCNGRNYLFLKYEYYTVSFVFGSETLTTQSVLNGKAPTDPGDGTKEGYVFLGWYADSSYTERYEFNTSITSDTTIYARFIEVEGATEYKVTYDFGNGETVTAETLNGKIYDLPEAERSGYTFLGWWVSATNNADELTYRYDGDVLCEDTTLFAVYASGSYIGASVRDDGIYWENYSASVTDIILRDESGYEVDRFTIQSTDQEYSYDFASLPAGKYFLVIEGGGIDETLVYVSHALTRVSGFTVISGSILMYSAVENAERYYITIDCGTEGHDHSLIDNGTSLYYDFSSCDMPSTGITFTVYAYADGYYYSVSSYNWFLGLEKTEVTVEGSLITWTPVSMAMQYEVYIDGTLVATTSDTSYSLSGYGTGTYEIAVRPVTDGYYSELSEAYTFTKTTLASPSVTGIEDYTITWTEVEGATGYKVSINGVETTVDGGSVTSLILSDDNYTAGLDEYEISVKATAADSANDSPYSEAITVTGNSVGSAVSYSSNTVTWQYSLSAAEYRITVNDGDEIIVTGTNSASITLTKSGNNEITIYFVNGEGEIYGTASITVYAYAIVFDARGGTAVLDGEEIDTIYVAKGDTVTLPDADRGAITADFIGWYTLPDTTDDPDATEYQGDGYLFEDGTVFNGNATIVLYAAWVNPRMLIALDPGMGTLTDADGNVVTETYISLNGRSYTIAVPVTGDAQYAFYGWYSGENGTGTRYTDENGEAFAAFSDESVTTLYARWIQVLTITSASYNTSGGDNVFSVSNGPDISLVSEVTIPESYTVGGVEYTQGIMSGTAFSSCTRLKTVNVPDTMIYIDITNNGYDAGTGVFEATSLENVNVYATGEPSTTKEVIYYSEGGVLFWVNTNTGDVELLYYPYGRTDETYAIPETVSNENEYELSGRTEVPVVRYVNAIAASAFREHRELTFMSIPEFITVIGSSTFYGCTSLTGVEFQCEIDKIEDSMFYGCKKLASFEVPDTVREIGDSAFRECSSLKTFRIPETVESVGSYVFRECTRLETVYLSSSMDKVGDYMFYGDTKLRGVEIPNGVEALGNYCFYQCSSLTSIDIPGTVTSIGNYTFCYCSGLEELNLPAGLTSLGTYTFEYCSGIREVVFPEGLTAIGNYDFMYCYALSYVVFPESLETIGSGAFEYCYLLSSIVIPASVKSIGSQAFYGDRKLVEVYDLSGLNITTNSSSNGYAGYYASVIHTSLDEDSIVIRDGGFLFTESENGYVMIGYEGTDPNPEIPADIADEICEISSYAFYHNNTIETLYLPDSITHIGTYAFAYCDNLVYVGLPAYITSIESDTFEQCTSLVAVTIPAGVTSIGSWAFNGDCKLVEIVNLSSSVELTMGSSSNGYAAYYAKSIVTREEDSRLSYEDGFLSVRDEEGNYYLVGYYGDATDIVFPDYVDGHEYEIMDYAFDGNDKITGVTFGKGTTKTGTYSFRNCTSLTSVTTGEGMAEIGTNSFYGCSSLEIAVLGDALETIGQYAFYQCVSLRAVTLGDNVKEVGNYAFYGCEAAETLSLGSSLETIGNYAFYGLEEVRSVYVPASVRTIGNHAFSGCISLKSISFSDGIESFGRGALEGTGFYNDYDNWDGGTLYCGSILVKVDTSYRGALYVKDGTTIIGGDACYGCDGMTRAILPESVLSVGDYAFYNCTSLTAINLPDSVTYLGTYAFNSCYRLQSIHIPAGITSIGEFTFSYCDSLRSVTIPSNVTEIQANAFYRCSSLEDVIFPSTLTSIGTYAFYYCTSLKSVAMPDSLTTLGTYAFYGCTALESVVLNEGLESIGSSAFYNCYSLTSINIPSTVTSIGSSAFCYCYRLAEVYNLSGISISAGSSSDGYVGNYAVNVYTAESGESRMTQRGDFEFIYDDDGNWYLVAYTGSDVNVTLPDGVDGHAYALNSYAFAYDTSIESVIIPSSVTTIGDYAFRGCTALTSVTLSEGLQAINQYAFYQCAALKGIVIPSTVTTIGSDAFYGCYALASVTLNEGLETINSYAFYDCRSLTSITIPSTVTTIGSSAFNYCYDLAEVYNLSAIEITAGSSSNGYIGYYAKNVYTAESGESKMVYVDGYSFIEDGGTWYLMGYEGSDTDLVLPDGVDGNGYEIYQYAFYGRTDLVSVVIPGSVTSIGTYAFRGCSALSSVILSEGLETIGTYVFYNCCSLLSITIPSTVTSIGTQAFYGCYSMADVGNFSSLSITAGGSSNGYVGNYAVNIYTGTSGESHLLFSDGCAFVYDDEGNYYLTGYVGEGSVLCLPEYVNDHEYSILKYAFYGLDTLTAIVMPATVTEIGTYAFNDSSSLKVVYFEGTEDEWGTVTVGSGNSPFTSAALYFYSDGEPEEGGCWWHYDGGNPAIW